MDRQCVIFDFLYFLLPELLTEISFKYPPAMSLLLVEPSLRVMIIHKYDSNISELPYIKAVFSLTFNEQFSAFFQR